MRIKRRKTVNVTKDDIAKGFRCNAGDCPVARAISRTLGGAVNVWCGFMSDTSDYYWQMQRRQHIPGHAPQRYRLPPKVARFIINFDFGKAVEPFGFTLLYSEEVA